MCNINNLVFSEEWYLVLNRYNLVQEEIVSTYLVKVPSYEYSSIIKVVL